MSPPSRSAVIIGAGITGTLTANALRRAGWEVTVVDAAHVGAGSSSRTAAGIRQQFSTAETVLGMRYAVDFYRRFPAEVGGLVVPIVQNGYLFLLDEAGVAPARDRVALQRGCGLDEVELLSAEETTRRFPFVDPDSVAGATWCPTDGFLRPEIVYGEATAAARARGVPFVLNAPVRGARQDNGRITAIQAGDRWISADLFIDATNAWSPRLAALLGTEPLPISPLKRYLWFIERAGPMTAEALLGMPMVVTPGGAYCHPENADILMTGWAHEAVPEPAFTYEDQDRVDPAWFHGSGPDSHGYETWFNLAGHLPPVGEFAGITATTSGFYGTTPDHNPFLGYDPQIPNLLHLAGFSGHGAMFGPFSAAIGLAKAEAGRDIERFQVLGREVSLAAFSLTRAFTGHEAMVI